MEKKFKDPANFYNRELSWIKFNERVLEESMDESRSIYHRVKFLGITASNLDEFHMVRVASLKDMVHADYTKKDISGMTVTEQLKAISKELHKFNKAQTDSYKAIVNGLEESKIYIAKTYESLSDVQKKAANDYFNTVITGLITPIIVSSQKHFPLLSTSRINVGAFIRPKGDKKKDKKRPLFATIQIVKKVPRWFYHDGTSTLIPVEEIVRGNMGTIFPCHKVLSTGIFRIIRNADLDINDEEAADLLTKIEKQIKMRDWGEVIRLDVKKGTDKEMIKYLRKAMKVSGEDVYHFNTPIDLASSMSDLNTYVPYDVSGTFSNDFEIPEECDGIFDYLEDDDILLYHPYDSFKLVSEFIESAASNPDVVSIKQTLYRVSDHSPIIKSLCEAATNGKDVTVMVELKARFDENNNINISHELMKAGCNVIFGIPGLKCHSKMTLVTIKGTSGRKKMYAHLGTGNYNDKTARLYTDCSLFTHKREIVKSVAEIFSVLETHKKPDPCAISIAPYNLRDTIIDNIKETIDCAKRGVEASIVAKMNSLCDKEVISRLYEASSAGVKIKLIVRGICCLKAGVPGLSDNIEVRSIVGDYLEHARISEFTCGDVTKIYISSADWMPRNLDKRIEVLVPITDEVVKNKLHEILCVQLEDNYRARVMMSDGSYVRKRDSSSMVDSQSYFITIDDSDSSIDDIL